jgi:hypothetical protein
MRHTNPALLEGSYIALNENDPNVLSYLRSYQGRNVLVVLNMSGVPQKVSLDLASKAVSTKSLKTLLSSFPMPAEVDPAAISIEPFGAWIAEIK